VGLTAEKYSRMLKQILPPGALWLLEADRVLARLLLALGDELTRASERAAALVEEADPRTATETLDEWERLLGLPDSAISVIPATAAERRLAITQKLISQGGQRAAYYVALAAACGYTVTVEDGFSSDVTRAGTAVAGDFLEGLGNAFTWNVVVEAPSGTALSHAELEAVLNRAKPAHTTITFEYL
jgi:uncharacterized protein YmfQ (DUF2313 family)